MTDQKSLRTRLKDGETVFGMFYKLNSPLVTEIMGWSGLDFIVVDCEHSAIGYESVEDIVRTGEMWGCPPSFASPPPRRNIFSTPWTAAPPAFRSPI